MATGLSELLAKRLGARSDIKRWVVAYSGGLDSSVLLHLCASVLPKERLLALHVDHQLQPVSGTWAKHCAGVCAELGVELITARVAPSDASEAAARDARYALFEQTLRPGDCLLLAQHADDQVETLLLRLLRGAGVRGLSAMPERRALGRAELYRPLLDQPRQCLERWAREQAIDWVEDPSNASDKYDRNWLRLHLLPPLLIRWPRLYRRVAATTQQMQEAAELLDERAAEDLQQLEDVGGRLSISGVLRLSVARQRNLLRYWIRRRGDRLLSATELEHLESQMLAARADAQPTLSLGKYQLRRYRDYLYLLEALPSPSSPRELTLTPGVVHLHQGALCIQSVDGVGLQPGLQVELAYRRGGERLRPWGRGGSVTLKQLLQESGVPPWWRADWPLLVHQGQIVAVPSLCLCEEFAVQGGLMVEYRPFGLSESGVFGKL